MRLLILAAVLLPQGRVEFKTSFQRFDTLAIRCVVQSEVTSSDGKDSRYAIEADLSAEVDKSEAGVTTFDCGVSALKLSGTFEGKKVDCEWRKDGSGRGDMDEKLRQALEKGWKMTLEAGKGFAVVKGGVEFCDRLPILNPGVFLGLSAPLPAGEVAVGGKWEVDNLVFPYFNSFLLKYQSVLERVEKDTARVRSGLAFRSPEGEDVAEGVVDVKGEGESTLEFDLKAGRPRKGSSMIRLTSAQGSLKRQVVQSINIEVK